MVAVEIRPQRHAKHFCRVFTLCSSDEDDGIAASDEFSLWQPIPLYTYITCERARVLLLLFDLLAVFCIGWMCGIKLRFRDVRYPRTYYRGNPRCRRIIRSGEIRENCFKMNTNRSMESAEWRRIASPRISSTKRKSHFKHFIVIILGIIVNLPSSIPHLFHEFSQATKEFDMDVAWSRFTKKMHVFSFVANFTLEIN